MVLVAERHTSSGQELRTQKMGSAAAGSVLCREATERSSRREGLAVAPVLDLEDPCYRSLAQLANKNEIFRGQAWSDKRGGGVLSADGHSSTSHHNSRAVGKRRWCTASTGRQWASSKQASK